MIVEAFVSDGVASGALPADADLRAALDAGPDLVLADVTWFPLSDGKPGEHPTIALTIEEIVLITGDLEASPVHATWHAVELDAGPYAISAELPTQPGFDPGRALSRPGGAFLLLRDVRIGLRVQLDGPPAVRSTALVNRYQIDRVGAEMDFGFYFPGARFETLAGVPSS